MLAKEAEKGKLLAQMVDYRLRLNDLFCSTFLATNGYNKALDDIKRRT